MNTKTIISIFNITFYLRTGWHGNLTCFTCLIDHRWICKIADYGFKNLKTLKRDGSSDLRSFSKWIAPEFHGDMSDFGSTEGDVYSFAVICQEVLMSDEIMHQNDPKTSVGPLEINNALEGKKICVTFGSQLLQYILPLLKMKFSS